jgi:hypothetical protein
MSDAIHMKPESNETEVRKDDLQVVAALAESKKHLQIQGFGDVNPFHEALTALLRRNLSDAQLVARFARNDEANLRTSIATDVLLERVPAEQRRKIISLYERGSSLEEIALRAALEMGEGKSVQDGRLLIRADREVNTDGWFMKAVARSAPSTVYVEMSQLPELTRQVRRMKRIRAFRRLAFLGITVLILGMLAYLYRDSIRQGLEFLDRWPPF